MSNCPNCGSSGIDLVFAFYCDNPSCKNYKVQKLDEKDANNKGFLPCRLHIDEVYVHRRMPRLIPTSDFLICLAFSVRNTKHNTSTTMPHKDFQLAFSWDHQIKVIPALTFSPDVKPLSEASYQWFTIVGNAEPAAIQASIADKSAGWRKDPYEIRAFRELMINNAIYKPSVDSCPAVVKIKDCFCNKYIQLV